MSSMDPQRYLAAMDLGAFEKLISDMISHEGTQQAVNDYNVFRQRDPDVLALRLANVLQQSTNVEIRNWSAILLEILLEELIEEPLAENTQNMVKDILLTRVEIEDDENIRVSLCGTIATAFSVFGGENGWPQLFPFIRRCVLGYNDVLQESAMRILGNLLEKSTNVDIRARSAILLQELIEQPLDALTINMVKYILLTCVEKEDEIIVRKSLCHTIATAFHVFRGENGWPELFPFIRRCVSGHNEVLQEAALLILGNLLLQESTNVEIIAMSAILLQELIGKPLDVPTKNLVKDILIRCAEKENEIIVTKSLCITIATAYDVFGGENGWPELFSFIDRCVSGRNDFLQETAMLILPNLLEQSTNVKTRARSAILLRKLLIRKQLDAPTVNLVKDILLRCVEKENERNVRKSLCHTIATAFHVFRGENGWPELFPFIGQCVSVHNDLLQETAMLILGSLHFDWINHRMISLTKNLISKCLINADSVDVRIAAVGAAISYLQHPLTVMSVDLKPVMMQVLAEGLNGWQDVTTQEALKSLIKWAHQMPPLYIFVLSSGMQLVGFVESAFKIAESQILEKETRHLAIDFLITLGEVWIKISETMRPEFPYASNRLFGILMFMLSDIALHSAENEDDDAGESRNYSVVLEFLDRLAPNLYQKNAVVLKPYLAAFKWQKRVAAIVAVAHISEVYLKATEKTFNQLVTMVLDLFQDRDSRVRLAAINATGQLSTKLDPDLQLQYHLRVLPALATAIYDFQYPRVQGHAVSAMVNISKNYPSGILTSYIYETVSTLVKNDLASDQTRSSTINLLRQFRRTLPAATWAAIWPVVHPDLQMALLLSS